MQHNTPRHQTHPRIAALRQWFDSSVGSGTQRDGGESIDWVRAIPFICMHVACAGVVWVGASATALWVALVLYALRMFAITGFYHRYFAHRSFRASRAVQFAFAVLGAASVQRGPLWWAAHHRRHHRHADTAADPHSPRQGFWHSHVGWILTRANFHTDTTRIGDLLRFPELRWLDRFDVVVPALLAAMLYGAGEMLRHRLPALGTDGPQLLVWGFFVSTVVLFHATAAINSLAHRRGHRHFDTRDDSRNNLWLALLTFGEGWHNNHHYFPGCARQGFRWWEIDLTWYGLCALRALGLVHDLKPVPAWVLAKAGR